MEDFVRFEVRENDLLLTNISDRPINAWMIKTVVRSSQGYEAYALQGIEAYRSSSQPGGGEGLLEPGESVAIEKPQSPWLREDHRGPGAGVYYEVGAITFEGGEAAGDPEVIDRLFADRLLQAKDALRAIEATADDGAGDADFGAELPKEYRDLLERFADRQEAIRAIQRTAWDDYHAALANLRPQDLVDLPTPQEIVR